MLLSGGLDSATAAAIARSDGFDLFALTIAYGQRHRVEIEAARAVARALGAERHVELQVDLSAFGGSALTDRIDVPKDRDLEASGIPSTYVPARNTVFLSLAMAWAEAVGAQDIYIGVNALDYSGYPDCRPEFIAAFERLAALATKAGVEGATLRVHAPLMQHDEGGDHPARDRLARRLRPDAQLLRSRPGGHAVRPLRQLQASSEGIRRGGRR